MFDMYKFYCSLLFLNLMFCFGSCVKIKDIYEEQEFRNYLYPYSSENSEIDLELLVQLKENSAKDDIKAQIPIKISWNVDPTVTFATAADPDYLDLDNA